MNKKLLALSIATLMVFGMTACSGNDTSKAGKKEINSNTVSSDLSSSNSDEDIGKGGRTEEDKNISSSSVESNSNNTESLSDGSYGYGMQTYSKESQEGLSEGDDLLTKYTLEFTHPLTNELEETYDIWLPNYESNFISENKSSYSTDTNFEGITISVSANYLSKDSTIEEELLREITNKHDGQVASKLSENVTDITPIETVGEWLRQSFSYERIPYTDDPNVKTDVVLFAKSVGEDKYILIITEAEDKVTEKALNSAKAFKEKMGIV